MNVVDNLFFLDNKNNDFQLPLTYTWYPCMVYICMFFFIWFFPGSTPYTLFTFA